MPYSHHSHSGQFCNHAVDQLEDVILEAIRQGMKTFALTEHMPRNEEADLYPGEKENGWSLSEQAVIYDNFYHTARTLQQKYKDEIELLVGIEIDWIRPSTKEWVEGLLKKYPLDLFVGSVHHVYGIPIDFDRDHYDRAVELAGNGAGRQDVPVEEVLFEAYFDSQYAMLQALKPPIIGHFDLIRLLSDNKNTCWESYPGVWNKIKRNLDFIHDYDAALELNGSGLRKGLQEPYPKLEICKYFNSIGGKFVFSDDSHGIKQIGHSYEGLLSHARASGIRELAVFSRNARASAHDQRFPKIGINMISVEDVENLNFWSRTVA